MIFVESFEIVRVVYNNIFAENIRAYKNAKPVVLKNFEIEKNQVHVFPLMPGAGKPRLYLIQIIASFVSELIKQRFSGRVFMNSSMKYL